MSKNLSTFSSARSLDTSARQLEGIAVAVTVLPATALVLPEAAAGTIVASGVIGAEAGMGGELMNQIDSQTVGGNYDLGKVALRGAEGFTIGALFKGNQIGLSQQAGKSGLGPTLGAGVLTALEAGPIVGMARAGYAWATGGDPGQAGGMGLVNGTVGGLMGPVDDVAPGSSTVVNDQLEKQIR